ncbi:RluA family pseudouridine synthase [Desulfallas thermosapovorans]|uniref:Pseudouridine synthase n=1 Tax=Desulfallas thermosapovorans DSM 6562 TaxID=1121431 RepID=A0A5S4ZRG7_9FIRM|nr:RluA family pseudouridine synthase [Desulfallas thermosapovorans]TYO94685.1 23S rRNA pseudouridine1911/1915/1917 synthase [Desulfallas thermosapovorans DSM 6562]
MNGVDNNLIINIGPGEAGCTVENLLRKKRGFSRALVRGLKTRGQVLVNGVRVYMRDKVKAGDVLTVCFPKDDSTELEPENIPLEILYEDADVLVLNKPAGMLVHPVRHEQHGTLANAVLFHWQHKGVKARFRPVYRIDRNTSGIVLVAGNSYAAQQLARQLDTGVLRRRYLAVAEGTPPRRRGTIDLPLALKPGSAARWTVDPGGKQAVTHFQLISKLMGASLLCLELETGRTHQIRVHMSHIGCPLVGDEQYGGDTERLGRQALHAATIDFCHPRTGVPVRINCPLPADMRGLIKSLSIN